MAEEFGITGTRTKFKGTFSLSSYYNLKYDILRRLGYIVVETKYRVKNIPGSSELEFAWDAYKNADSYTRYRIRAKTLIVGLEKKEIMLEGVPVAMEKGDVELELKCSLITDYDNRWQTNPILKMFKPFYDRYIYRPVFKEHENAVANHMYTVENAMKEFFKMETFS